MAKMAQLSTGCMECILTGQDYDCPVLQILGYKKIPGPDGMERYRLLVSDGKYLNSFTMLSTQQNELVTSGKLGEFAIVRVDRYTTSLVNKTEKAEKRVLILLDLTVLNHGSEVGKKIGNPTPFSGEVTTSTSKPAATPSLSNQVPTGVNRMAGPSEMNRPSNTSNNNVSNLNQSINDSVTYPISSLSPYQNKWVIKARVVTKSAIRTWSNAKGEGKLFSMDVMDESGTIRVTAFKEQCDKFYNMIQPDKVYYISKGSLKPANKQFNNTKHDYEITFTNETVVQPCEDDEDNIPQVQYDLLPISQIINIEPKAAVDIIGVCKEIGELQVFTGKTNNKEFKKRDITLVDRSNASVQLSLWGDDAVNFEGHVQPVIVVKGVRVTEFGGGKSLSLGSGSLMKINPDIPEGHQLRGWFDNGGADNISNSVSARSGALGGSFSTDWCTFRECRDRNLGSGDKPDYFQNKAVVHIVKSTNAIYKACPNAQCNKKLVEDDHAQYRCEKCNATHLTFKYRLLLNLSVGDWTSNQWVTCFSDQAEQLLGKTAEEIGAIMDSNQSDGEALLSSINFESFVFKIRTKMEVFGDINRSKMSIVSVAPVNYKEYNKYLLQNLERLTGIGKN